MAEPLPLSLIQAFASVPDPRSPLGRRHPLPAVLALVSVGIMCGCRSIFAVLQWGRDQGQPMAQELGLGRHGIPTDGMMSNLLRRLNIAAFEAALAQWAARWPPDVTAATDGLPDPIRIDGKTLRGTRGHAAPGVHLLAAYASRLGLVLNQVPAGANKDEGGEITAAPALLKSLVLQGKVVTGDAIHAQQNLCAQIVEQDGDYLLAVKENQPTLLTEVTDVFRAPADPLFRSATPTSTAPAPSGGRSAPAARWPVGTSGQDCGRFA